jgi:putative ATP-dependent endonuclease of OLD family
MFAGVLAGDGDKRSTVVTTHSPHIVSVAPPKQLVVLRDEAGETNAFAASNAKLGEASWDDLGRYLDATRSELVFARRVLLVEGFAEQVLLPQIAAPDLDFDEHGVTVCVIHGTHFGSYVRFVRAIGTPYAVITDGDPGAGKGRTGAERLAKLAALVGKANQSPEKLGLFAGDETFESDLFDASHDNEAAMFSALESFTWAAKSKQKIAAARKSGETTGEEFLAWVTTIGKGRFAQRLAAADTPLDPPVYVRNALKHLMS